MEGKSWFLLLILLYSSSVTGPNTNDLPIVGWIQWFLLISLAGLLSAYFISGIRCHRGPPAQPVEMRSSWSCLLILGLGLVALPLQALTLDECGEELHNMYPGCRKVKATLPPSDTSVDAIQHLLPDALTASAHVIVVNYSHTFTINEIGAMTDRYLQSRPHWTVFQEEYPWMGHHRMYHVVYIRLNNIDKPLMSIARVMNPIDCSQRYLIFKGYHDFDEYGNEHGNLALYADQYMGAIPLVHIKQYAKFIDDGYCPDQINKYLCAFLPMTNCSLPKHYLECKDYDGSCTPGSQVYSSASTDATILYEEAGKSDIGQKIPRFSSEPFSMVGEMIRSHEPLNFEHVSAEKYLMGGIGSLYFTSIFLRKNYDFRTRIADMIHKFRFLTKPHFSPTKQCVGIHIRHHDRAKPGYDMMKFCQEFVLDEGNSCHNRTTGGPIEGSCGHYHNYGCHTPVPFGAITMEAYLKAAELLLEKPHEGRKTAYIITDDGAWVSAEISQFMKDWDIYVFPAQPNHRSRATVNGVTLFASMEVLQQCSGLVGHSTSAFTMLLRAIMCVRHGPRYDMRFGECPKFFDFGSLAH